MKRQDAEREAQPLDAALKTTTEANPRPPMADDPRPAHWRNTGGPWAPWGL